MRIINIIESKFREPYSITSFPIWEEQLSNDVVKEAEDYFTDLIKKNDGDMEDSEMDYYLEEGVYDGDGDFSCYIMWSNI